MVKSYFMLYKRAKKLYDEDKVQLTEIKGDKYYFQSNGHSVMLQVKKIAGRNKTWMREWSCDCESFSIWQERAECKHVKSCELYLMNN